MLEGYQVVKELGSGAYSKVFLVELHSKLYAAKAIPKYRQVHTSNDHQSSLIPNDNLIIKEIKTLQRLNHPNIISIIDVVGDSNNIYIIQEYIENSLFKVITQQKKIFLEFSAKPLIIQILDAVCYLHSVGICHRDIKPQNILIDSTGSIRLIDFGLSAPIDAFDIRCGSNLFFPPEVMVPDDKQKPIDGCKCDSWACGITFYLMLTGKMPWSKMTYSQITTNSIKYPPYMSVACIDFINKLLQLDPNERISVQEAFEHEFLTKSIRSCISASFSVHSSPIRHMSMEEMDKIMQKEFPNGMKELVENHDGLNSIDISSVAFTKMENTNVIKSRNRHDSTTKPIFELSPHEEKNEEFNSQIEHIYRKIKALRKSSI